MKPFVDFPIFSLTFHRTHRRNQPSNKKKSRARSIRFGPPPPIFQHIYSLSDSSPESLQREKCFPKRNTLPLTHINFVQTEEKKKEERKNSHTSSTPRN